MQSSTSACRVSRETHHTVVSFVGVRACRVSRSRYLTDFISTAEVESDVSRETFISLDRSIGCNFLSRVVMG